MPLPSPPTQQPQALQKQQLQRQNIKMGLVLASIAVVFFVGFFVKMAILQR